MLLAEFGKEGSDVAGRVTQAMEHGRRTIERDFHMVLPGRRSKTRKASKESAEAAAVPATSRRGRTQEH